MKKKSETYIFRISFYIQFVFFLVSLIVLVPLDILGAEEKKINTIDKSILSENSERKGKEESYTIARVNQKESQNERSQSGYLGPSGSIGGGILIRNEGINKYEEIGIDLENHPGYRIGRYKIRKGAKMRHTDLAIRSSDYMPLAFFEEMIFIAGVVCGDEGADIYANQWSENGLSEEKKWSAISALPDERRGWYVSPNGLKSLSLDKISGDRTRNTGSRLLRKPFGDFIVSSPVVVANPPFFYPFNNYSAFANTTLRKPNLYIQSNTGSIHALNLKNGVEIWSFLPQKRSHELDVENESSKQINYFEPEKPLKGRKESLQVGDVYAKFGNKKKEWRTILVASNLITKPSYVALDITSGKGFEDPNPPKLLWQFHHEKLGQGFSDPAIERVTVAGKDEETAWGVFLVSGRINGNPSDNKNYLFGITAEKAGELWMDDKRSKTNHILISNLPKDRLADPLAVDFNNDYTADRIYMGNLYGDMFRVEKIGKHMTPKVSKLFSFNSKNASENPIRSKAVYTYCNNLDEVWIYFGTGSIESLEKNLSRNQQYFLGLRENLNDTASYHLEDLITLKSSFKKIVNNRKKIMVRVVSGHNPHRMPWKMALHGGKNFNSQTGYGEEQVISKPLLFGGMVIFTTFIPIGPKDNLIGDTWIIALDSNTGLAADHPVFDLNRDGLFDQKDMVSNNGELTVPVGIKISEGIGSSPMLYKENLLVINNKAISVRNEITEIQSKLINLKINISNNRVRLESWRNRTHRKRPRS